ncbi:hypothetical protein BO78DRAFT_396446 [Aspergillus sclerotiicarbonarius CBS 121057]|uniref:Uncharacterized protein n=1 Tax=Aspergillus sclerotiicarbonarius (strain CBS 121057 / IBT 28362) TaxID=1448318 RepID=A0A319FIS2_ASPSB|nr:hypothetical protein BO78DRAFT_396446 [Aspergillus sclerotiicarbonarius CBS 121057]
MARVIWSEEETAIALVLSMWGFRNDTIAALLTRKSALVRGILDGPHPGSPVAFPQYERTEGAVANKLQRIRETHKSLWLPDQARWNRAAVIDFISVSHFDMDLINSLLHWTDSDIHFFRQRAEVDGLRPVETTVELRQFLQSLGMLHLTDRMAAALGLTSSG